MMFMTGFDSVLSGQTMWYCKVVLEMIMLATMSHLHALAPVDTDGMLIEVEVESVNFVHATPARLMGRISCST